MAVGVAVVEGAVVVGRVPEEVERRRERVPLEVVVIYLLSRPSRCTTARGGWSWVAWALVAATGRVFGGCVREARGALCNTTPSSSMLHATISHIILAEIVEHEE